jgi:hypothetical protein
MWYNELTILSNVRERILAECRLRVISLLMLRIREVPGSDLGPETDYLD